MIKSLNEQLDNIEDVITPQPKAKRGFAAMDIEQRKRIAALGGAAVQPHNRAFSQNSELARMAGKKGGQMSHGGGRKRKFDNNDQ